MSTESLAQPESDEFERSYCDYRNEVRRLQDESYDRYMRAFYRRLDVEHAENPSFDAEIRHYIGLRPEETAAMRASKVFRACQFLVIPPLVGGEPAFNPDRLRDPSYPRGRTKPEAWDDVFELIDQNGRDALEFTLRLWGSEIKSNVHERATALRIGAMLFGINIVRGYSAGHSLGNVEKTLAFSYLPEYHYERVHVGTADASSNNGIRINKSQTNAYNWLLRDENFWVESFIGVDLTRADRDPIVRDWALSCSFRPSELLNPKRRAVVERLLRIKPLWYKFMGDDFSDPGHLGRLYAAYPWLQEQRPNLSIHSFSLYQDTDDARARALANVEEILDPDEGVALVLDFVEKQPDGSLQFDNQDRGWMTRLYAKDMANKDAGWQHILTARDGRVRQVQLGDAVSRLALGAMRS